MPDLEGVVSRLERHLDRLVAFDGADGPRVSCPSDRDEPLPVEIAAATRQPRTSRDQQDGGEAERQAGRRADHVQGDKAASHTIYITSNRDTISNESILPDSV